MAEKTMQKKILITSALPYVNNIPHLGNIIGCVLSADVFARYCRLRGYDICFVCGSDESGTTTEAKALEEGLTPKALCDKYHAIHEKIYSWFNISFDTGFGRTSTETHYKTTQEIFLALYRNGFIEEGALQQLYCKKCKKFLADRYVEGTCPKCSYENARGDQCDQCGRLHEPTELLHPRCKLCNSAPEIRETKHLFLSLDKLQHKLGDWFRKQHKEGFWKDNAVKITEAWLLEGLKKRCITRDLKWGVPVPLKGFEDKVFYVWFDAPIGYISITKDGRKDWKTWWKNEKARLYQFMAKDNVPFHTIVFPAALIGADLGFNLLYHIDSTEYLNYEAGKFSKSRGIGVFGDDAMQAGIDADVWRFYLLRMRPEHADTEFSWKVFQEKNNNELLANLGNLVNRALVFMNRQYNSIMPELVLQDDDNALLNKIREMEAEITRKLEAVQLRDALEHILEIAHLANGYFQKQEPWKQGKERAATVAGVMMNVIKDLAILLEPYLPQAAEAIFSQLNIGKKTWDDLGNCSLETGHAVAQAKPLFRRIEDKEIQALSRQFAGRKKTITKPLFPLDLRVAEIVSAEDHPNADKLYVLKIDIGTGKRQLVAGIRGFYSKNELMGKKIIVVANLKHAVIRGIASEGMLLAAEHDGIVKVLSPKKSFAGEHVFLDGHETAAAEVTIDELMKLGMHIKGKKVLSGSSCLKTAKETISADMPDGSKIR